MIKRLNSQLNPAIYLQDVRHEDIKNVLEFMYPQMIDAHYVYNHVNDNENYDILQSTLVTNALMNKI